jgi:GntR family transcriptional repressor for pyruvate dehydrogenase complex
MEKKFAVEKKKLYEGVIEQFTTLLQSGEYKVGDKLPSISDLSTIFEVGKPTLREALSVLTSAGVIEIHQGSGIFIKRLSMQPDPEVLAKFPVVDSKNLLHWLEFRLAIEVESAGLAAERRSTEDIEQLEDIEGRLEEEIKQGKIASELDYSFHYAIAMATYNPIFPEAIKSNAHFLQQQFFESLRQSVDVQSRRELILPEHNKIIEAIKKGKPSEARQAMHKHIKNAERKMKLVGLNLNE